MTAQIVKQWLSDTTRKFDEAGITSARLDAELLLANALNKDRAWLIAHPDYDLNIGICNEIGKLVERRINREPLAYILGYKEFYGLRFEVTHDVLVPRPETEMMVEYAIKHSPKNAKVLELGTGSGCIAVSLAANRSDLAITATDISPSALKIARTNSLRHKSKIKFLQSNLFSNDKLRFRKYDMILANLPYVPEDTRSMPELSYEPDVALYAGKDGLDLYRKFIEDAKNYLEQDDQILIEASPIQRAKLAKLAVKNNLKLMVVSEYIFSLVR